MSTRSISFSQLLVVGSQSTTSDNPLRFDFFDGAGVAESVSDCVDFRLLIGRGVDLGGTDCDPVSGRPPIVS